MNRGLAVGAAITVAAFVFVQCGTSTSSSQASARAAAANVSPEARRAGVVAFETVYRVLQHPRCLNCHPIDRVPLQGDDSHPHGQNVQGGDDGRGLFAMRCSTCHRDENSPDAHQPPGAPNWHLPEKKMPLVFEGRTRAQLAKQLADPTQNGGKSMDQMLHHVAEDALVGWGWAPGTGRTPVPVPRAEFVAAMKTWIDAGCPAPE